eukprot:CAMPEP_0172688598 /NCGR_PEP_ID=MMETSP1074-20121228/22529_1 /TAXON_ID=2916 /ORGANISM="Ceratium fusus, Strain PA161109" /LENGTH=121 /DNA_ID=CAMNT_0013508269 /DNA_START=400 /DNA_END=766 /DNA_ORIENTATION=-
MVAQRYACNEASCQQYQTGGLVEADPTHHFLMVATQLPVVLNRDTERRNSHNEEDSNERAEAENGQVIVAAFLPPPSTIANLVANEVTLYASTMAARMCVHMLPSSLWQQQKCAYLGFSKR